MKEISYDGPTFDENEQRRKLARSRGSLTAPPLRTLHDDVEKMVGEQHITKTQMVIAETARREERGESRTIQTGESHFGRIIFLLVLMLAFGVGVGIYALIGGKTMGVDTTVKKPNRQASAEILISGSPREQIMADISIAFSDTKLATGKTRELVFVTKDSTGTVQDASTIEVLNALSLFSPPDILLNSLNESLSYGIYADDRTPIGYLIISTHSYPETFAGMLEWEKRMSDDLVPSMNPLHRRTALVDVHRKMFTDERIGGVDARVLRDKSGTMLLAYTVIDRNTLIITGGEEALRGLLLSVAQKTAP